MVQLLKTLNPATRIETEADARAVARASSIALWLSAARYAAMSGAMLMNFEAVRATAASQIETMGTAASADLVAYGIVGGPIVIALVEIGAGLWQWKRPGIVVPIIWLMLIAYGAFEFVRSGASLAGFGAVVAVLLIVGAVLHASAIRGASALAKFRAARAY
jgi:hypothetical protein